MTGIHRPDATCDGGDLDCGSGLLLIIRNAMQPLQAGGVLEVKSREISVREDLPAWCRMVGHNLLGAEESGGGATSYFIRKKGADEKLATDLDQARNYIWKARVRWDGGMQAKAFVRNHSFTVGQPASFDTADPHPSAVEFLLAALGGALTVGFQWRASRRGVVLRHLELSLQARADNILVFLGIESSGHPGLEAIEGKLFVDSDVSDEDLAAIWSETLEGCPLTQTLMRRTPVGIELRRA